jgi:hypothetical protein
MQVFACLVQNSTLVILHVSGSFRIFTASAGGERQAIPQK